MLGVMENRLGCAAQLDKTTRDSFMETRKTNAIELIVLAYGDSDHVGVRK